MYPTAGQQITPGTIQALTNLSSTDEDTANLKQQMAMAQALRAPKAQTDGSTEMAGKVAIRKSPLSLAASTAQNALSGYEQNQVMQQMKQQAQMLRNNRGQIISAEAAVANASSDPSKNHPDTNAQLGIPMDSSGGMSDMSGFPGLGDQ